MNKLVTGHKQLPPTPDSDLILLGWNGRGRSPSPQSTPIPQTTTTPYSIDTSIISSVGTSQRPSTSLADDLSNTDLGDSSAYSSEVREIFQRMTMGPQRQYAYYPYSQPQLNRKISQLSLDQATHTPLPPQTSEEIEPPTPMMKHEWKGAFGSAPLEVKSGVAVTEEAVELEVPDLIMDYGWDDEHLWRNGS